MERSAGTSRYPEGVLFACKRRSQKPRSRKQASLCNIHHKFRSTKCSVSNKMHGNFPVEAVIYEKPKRREFGNVTLSRQLTGNKHAQQGTGLLIEVV